MKDRESNLGLALSIARRRLFPHLFLFEELPGIILGYHDCDLSEQEHGTLFVGGHPP